jgi:hypothetical protein
MILRRGILLLLARVAISFATPPDSVLRGKLIQPSGKPPVLETADHRMVALTGDDATRKVLDDKRIGGMEVEVKGHFVNAGSFAIDRIETHSMVAIKDGKRYRVTYYCDVCAIRSFTPGLCVCCQQETRLDLMDASQD